MRLLKILFFGFLLLISAANLGFFIFWYAASEVTAIMPVNPTGYSVEALALNVTMLEIILVMVGFVFAALGLFGYTEIKRAAINAAEEEARQTVNEQIGIFKDILTYSQQGGAPEHDGSYGLEDQSVKDAEPAAEE